MDHLRAFKRRHFLTYGVASVMARPVRAAPQDKWAAAFAHQRPQQPWLEGYKSAPLAGYPPLTLDLPDSWPTEVSGTLYRNGPALHQFNGQRYHHWFDGDGMVHRYNIANGQLHYHGRFVETAKLVAERAAGKRLRSAFGSHFQGPPIQHPDEMNSANIAMLWHHGKLFALWEGGSPYEIDPLSLATRGPHSLHAQHFLPFTAHPKVDEAGHLWAIGYANIGNDRLFLYQIGSDGALRQFKTLRIANLPPVHDFVLTKDFLVIPLPPLIFNPWATAARTFIDSHNWRPDLGTRILLVKRADFSQTRIVETDPWWVFHYAGGWQDRDGTIRLHALYYPDPYIIYGPLRDVMRGQGTIRRPADAQPVEMTISANGAVNITDIADIVAEFPSRPMAQQMGRYDDFFAITAKPEKLGPQLTGLSRINLTHGVVDSFDFGDTVSVEEHLWRPADNNRAGWLIGTILDHQHQKTALCLFDAGNLSAGPRSRINLPHPIPLGLHGCFV
jgi:carotenoid cleavage dioxygenase